MANYQHTLCWDCANACGNCSWSRRDPMPVDGWVATPTKIKLRNPDHQYGEAHSNSYIVRSCPQFKRDAVEYGMKWAGKPNTIIRRVVKKK